MSSSDSSHDLASVSPAKSCQDFFDDFRNLVAIDEAPEIELIDNLENKCDMNENTQLECTKEDEESSENHLQLLSRSFSLPNLTFTPFESLLPTLDDLKEAYTYSDDFEVDSSIASPIKKSIKDGLADEDNEMWHENVLDPTLNTNIFDILESQRAMLEAKIGTGTLVKVYKMIAKLEQSNDEKIDYADLIKILGKGNEELIDEIIQLVVADQFFH